MNDIGVIDRFLDVFSRYIDSGFGLLQGEVAFAGNKPTPQFLRRFTGYVEQVRSAC